MADPIPFEAPHGRAPRHFAGCDEANVLEFPVEVIVRAPPEADTVTMIHRGLRLDFACPEDCHEALARLYADPPSPGAQLLAIESATRAQRRRYDLELSHLDAVHAQALGALKADHGRALARAYADGQAAEAARRREVWRRAVADWGGWWITAAGTLVLAFGLAVTP